MKKQILMATLALSALATGPAVHAADIGVSIGIGIPGFLVGPPVYYAPPPPPVVVVPRPVYVPGAPYYYYGNYDKHAYKHAEKRWRKQQERYQREYRRAYYGGDDDDD